MPIADYFFEPVKFFNSSYLLSGKFADILPENTEIITSLDLAMELENEKEILPNGYKVWTDAISEAVATFCCTDKAKEGEELLEPVAIQVWDADEDYSRKLQIKKLK